MLKMPEKIKTANGAVSCKINGKSPLVGLLYHTARGCQQERLESMLNNVWNLGLVHNPEDPLEPLDSRVLCLRAIANLRDPRGGKGERALGRVAWAWLARNHPDVFRLNMDWLVNHGCRLDDLLEFGTPGYVRLTRMLMTDQSVVLHHLHSVCHELSTTDTIDDKKDADPVYDELADLERVYDHHPSPVFHPSVKLAQLMALTPVEILKDKGKLADFLNLSLEQLEIQKCQWDHRPISLAAKWAPTEKGSTDRKKTSKKTNKSLLEAEILPRLGNLSLRQYRRCFLSPLRRYLGILERHMCLNQWEQINLPAVPSVALTRRRQAFQKHIPDKLQAYLDDVKSGKVQIKADQVMPHDLVRPYLGYSPEGLNPILEEQWKALVEKYSQDFGEQAIALVDVSGSMNGTPMEVAIALGLLTASARKFCLGENRARLEEFLQTDAGQLVAQNQPALWKMMEEMGFDDDGKPKKHPLVGKVLTFESQPRLFEITAGASLHDQVQQLAKAPWGGSTNFQAALELMLQTAIKSKLHPSDFPEVMYVFSDMQFNAADRNFYTNHQVMKQKFAQAGYRLPTMVYWNLNGSSSDCPIDNDEEHGVILLSGFSPDILKSLMEGKVHELTPLKAVLKILMNPRYDELRVV